MVNELLQPDILTKFIGLLRHTWKSRSLSVDSFSLVLRNKLISDDEREGLANQLIQILSTTKYVALLTESEIGTNAGFFTEAVTKFGYKLLPPIEEEDELRTQLNQYFSDKNDYEWVNAIPDEEWVHFLNELPWDSVNTSLTLHATKEMLNSIQVLAHRGAALGIEPEIVSKIPRADDLDSPFLGISREVTLYVENILHNPSYSEERKESDFKQILVMVRQCHEQINILHKHKDEFGISLRMTYLIRQLEQNLDRLYELVHILQATTSLEISFRVVRLFKRFVYAENTRFSLRKHFSDNMHVVTYKVVENTSKTGEHYIATTDAEYWRLFYKAVGGGVIVAFLCNIKTGIYYQHFPIFWEAFFYSMNYAVGFVLIHILHFTLATKQPAMTASTIAANLSNNGENVNWLKDTTKLLIQLIRSQFISLLGNALIAFPVAYALDWCFYFYKGYHIADYAKAIRMLDELNPWESMALPHAAIAGVYLMVSGLLSGYYQNKWLYNRLTLRMTSSKALKRVLGEKNLVNVAHYLENNIGGISGNIFLGILLGSTAAVGLTFGLPLDIRHITFASGNFGIAFASLNNNIPADLWINSILGIMGIGVVNVIVSFGLSILFALKSRNAGVQDLKSLVQALLWAFNQNSTAFFYPVKSIFIADPTQDKDEIKE